MTDPTSLRLAHLTHLVAQAEISPEEHAELEQLLLQSEAARHEYLTLLDLEFNLMQLASGTAAEQNLLPNLMADLGYRTSSAPNLQPGVSSSSQDSSPRQNSRQQPDRAVAAGESNRRIWFAVAAFCLLASLVAGSWTFSHWQRSTTPAASGALAQTEQGQTEQSLTNSENSTNTKTNHGGVVTSAEPSTSDSTTLASADQTPEMVLMQSARGRFFGEHLPAPGDALRLKHDYALVEGSVQLRSRSGAEMIIPAPAVFVVNSDWQVALKVGSCSVYAPPGAEGFRVLTPRAEVVDLGTRFSVSVAESGDADVQVLEGAAEVFSLAQVTPAGVLLQAGDSRAINPQGLITSAQEVAAARFGQQYQSQLPDRVLGFEVGSSTAAVPDELLAVSVQRGGEPYRYTSQELIGFDLLHFKATGVGSGLAAPLRAAVPSQPDNPQWRAGLLDRSLCLSTGVLNPGGSRLPLKTDPIWQHADPEQNTPGFAVRFHRPIVNHPGPDLVLFDLQVVVHTEQGDAFHVSPLRFVPGLRSHTIRKFDISLADRAAHPLSVFKVYRNLKRVHNLEQLNSGVYDEGYVHEVPAKAIAVGIDLSDLGYAAGAEVSELFFQDAMDDHNYLDPVFIGGLPPLGVSPASLNEAK